ncbi:MAG: dihydroorotase [Rikenellaceae bacterium]|nr:dihydroorotase [Rikenellaceae bacterium]
MNTRILLKGGTVVRNGLIERTDVYVVDGKIARVAADVQPAEGDKIYDCTGLTIMSGLVDLHVHLREPGFSSKETIATGTAAAAHGGFTTVCSMPNLAPAPDTMENLQQQLDIIERDAVIKVLPYATITRKRAGDELVNFAELKPYVAGFSDDGTGVQTEEVMRQAMVEAAKTDTIIAAHCEVDELLRGGYIHDGEYAAKNGHRGICSESEWKQVERDIELAAEAGCRYHVCHISTKQTVELIRQAKARGVKITCETGPHYLTMCDMDLKEEGRFKMNPPIRSAEDRDALIAGLQDGTIDVVATDHAPHTAEEKSRGLERSAMGVVGIETSFAVIYTKLVKAGIISLEKAVEVLAEAPRKIFKLGGGLKEGEAADIAVFDLEKEFTVDPDTFLSKGRSTPFEGWQLQGECCLTLVDGRVAYERK